MSNLYTNHASTASPAVPDSADTFSTPGLTRFKAPADVPSPVATSRESTRVHGGTLQMNMGGQEVNETGPARHVVSHSGTQGGSVLATMEVQGAGHRTVLLEPGNPSSRTRIEVAVRQGLLREVSPGHYEDAAPTQEAADSEQVNQGSAEEQADEGADTGAFDSEDMASWDAAIAPLSQSTYDAAAASATLAAVTGGDLKGAVSSLVSTGMEPEQARLYVEAGVAVHERAVAAAVAPLGITGDRLEAFYEAARQQPAKLQEAIGRLTQQRDTTVFKKMAQEWVRRNPGDLSAWTKAGFECHASADGLMIRRPGGDWVPAAALK